MSYDCANDRSEIYLKEMKMIDEEKIKSSLKEFIGEENLQWLRNEFTKDNLCLIYGSSGGWCGVQMRNFIRDKHKEIDEYFKSIDEGDWYAKFEDWFHPIVEEVVYGSN